MAWITGWPASKYQETIVLAAQLAANIAIRAQQLGVHLTKSEASGLAHLWLQPAAAICCVWQSVCKPALL